jgi:hypothetical protein
MTKAKTLRTQRTLRKSFMNNKEPFVSFVSFVSRLFMDRI